MQFLLICLLLPSGALTVGAQKAAEKDKPPTPSEFAARVEREVRAFYDAYAEDLRAGRGASIAERYDERGYYRMGAGGKQLVLPEEAMKLYTTGWRAPKSFAWRELSVDVLSDDSAAVTGLFDWGTADGATLTLSYTGVLTKRAGKWRIRVEDENASPNLYAIEPVSGNRLEAGPFKYLFKAQPTAVVPMHRHSIDIRLTVKSGRQFILMGDLENAKVRVLEAGATFTVPANVWHIEWWETATVVEIEGAGPLRTERASPATPRVP